MALALSSTSPITPALFSVGMYNTEASRPKGWKLYSIIQWPKHVLYVIANKIKGLWLKAYKPADITRSFQNLTFHSISFLSQAFPLARFKHLLSDLKNMILIDDAGRSNANGNHVLRMLNSQAAQDQEKCAQELIGALGKEQLMMLQERVKFEFQETSHPSRRLLDSVVNTEQFLYDRLEEQLNGKRQIPKNAPLLTEDKIINDLVEKLKTLKLDKRQEIAERIFVIINKATALNNLTVRQFEKLAPYFSVQQLVELVPVFKNYKSLLGFVLVELSKDQKKLKTELEKWMKIENTRELNQIFNVYCSCSVDLTEADSKLKMETLEHFKSPLLERGKTLLLANRLGKVEEAFEVGILSICDAKDRDKMTIEQIGSFYPVTREEFFKNCLNQRLLKYVEESCKNLFSIPAIRVLAGLLEEISDRQATKSFTDNKTLKRKLEPHKKNVNSQDKESAFVKFLAENPNMRAEVESLVQRMRTELDRK